MTEDSHGLCHAEDDKGNALRGAVARSGDIIPRFRPYFFCKRFGKHHARTRFFALPFQKGNTVVFRELFGVRRVNCGEGALSRSERCVKEVTGVKFAVFFAFLFKRAVRRAVRSQIINGVILRKRGFQLAFARKRAVRILRRLANGRPQRQRRNESRDGDGHGQHDHDRLPDLSF